MSRPAAWAAPYVGVPFVLGGRVGPALDCWGLVVRVYGEVFDRHLPTYDEALEVDEAYGEESSRWEAVPPGEAPREGDLVVFRLLGRSSHVGLAVGGGWFLHAWGGGTASCVERLDSPHWRKRLAEVLRWTN